MPSLGRYYIYIYICCGSELAPHIYILWWRCWGCVGIVESLYAACITMISPLYNCTTASSYRAELFIYRSTHPHVKMYPLYYQLSLAILAHSSCPIQETDRSSSISNLSPISQWVDSLMKCGVFESAPTYTIDRGTIYVTV